MESTRDTADTAASPTLATITESAMPTNMERNCSATRGSIINSTSRGLKISCSAGFFKVIPVLSPICCKGNFSLIVPPSRPGVNGQRESPRPAIFPLPSAVPVPEISQKGKWKNYPIWAGTGARKKTPPQPSPQAAEHGHR